MTPDFTERARELAEWFAAHHNAGTSDGDATCKKCVAKANEFAAAMWSEAMEAAAKIAKRQSHNGIAKIDDPETSIGYELGCLDSAQAIRSAK